MLKKIALATIITTYCISPWVLAADANLTVQAEVSGDFLSITAEQPLDFGAFTAPGSAATITITTAGVRTSSLAAPNMFLLGAATQGLVNVSGIAEQPVTLSVATPLNIVSGPTTLILDNVTFRADGAGADSPNLTLPVAAPGEFTSDIDVAVGGVLSVPANPAPGAYNGTLVVTVNY